MKKIYLAPASLADGFSTNCIHTKNIMTLNTNFMSLIIRIGKNHNKNYIINSILRVHNITQTLEKCF